MDISNSNCIKCKGRYPNKYCGRSFCPIYKKNEAILRVKDNVNKENYSGSAPTVFVGKANYPNLSVGILSPPDIKTDTSIYDAPKEWVKNNYNISQIIDLRVGLVNSNFKIGVLEKNKFLESAQLIAASLSPVDLDVSLNEKPRLKVDMQPDVLPMGPNGQLKQVRITENPKIHSKVDKVISDSDLKAVPALTYLYDHGFNENFLSKLLSIGNLGVKSDRKIVPTRWSITASDDILGKHIISEVKKNKGYDYCAYFGSYLGNYYIILFFPEPFSYELFETYLPLASWNQTNNVGFTTDYEGYNGRKEYAENCAGGYYSARLAVLEKLNEIKRQGSALVVRIITGEYACPLGVWVTREAARSALSTKPIVFSSKDLMLRYAHLKIKKLFNIDIDIMFKESIILRNLREQSKLNSYLS